MNCRHVHAAVQITSIGNADGTRTCMENDCGVDEGLWICTFCGEIYCGRYVKQHMLEHHEKKPKHCVCLDLTGLGAYCYVCDDAIMNDTGDKKLEQLRKVLAQKEEVEEEEEETEFLTPKKARKTPKRRSRKTASRNSQKRKRSTSSEDARKRSKEDSADQTKFKGVGLRNLGNTCYMNAVLQSLSNIQEFRCYFQQLPSLEELAKARTTRRKRRNADDPLEAIEDKGLMVEELRRILLALSEGNGKTVISPDSLYNVIFKFVPTFRSYRQQHDAHEFLICILDRLHCELREYSFEYPRRSGSPSSSSSSSSNSSSGSVKPACSNNYWSYCLGFVDFGAYNSIVKTYPGPRSQSSMVTSIFGGTLQSEISCLHCKHESKNHEAFLDLSLDIPSDYYPDRRGRTRIAAPDGPVCDISDCLHSFTRREELDENEFYNCPGCKGRQPIAKKFLIRKLPNVLILHLKRFHWIGTAHAKIDAFVKFPVRDLDMSDYVMPNLPETRGSKLGSNLYDLAAVIVHHGLWAGAGHYTAFALNEGNWYHFNDTTVKPTDEETVSSSKAYILFYIRREFRDS